jgi:thiamine biosynthesis lipoprotein
MSLDLGATAKGYAADQAAEVLRSDGIIHGMIEAGGDIRVIGPKADGSPWLIGIKDPKGGDAVHAAVIELSGGSVCTSGNYEQRYRLGSRTVSHIIDPRNGVPCDLIPSVTVIAPDALTSDALATALSVLGEQGLSVIEGMETVEALLIVDTDTGFLLRPSSGFAGFLHK